MNEADHPQVTFRLEGDPLQIAWGYLSIIDGVPWMARSLDEAASGIPAAMIRLDPQLLEEQRDSVTGEQQFYYRAVLRWSN